MFFPFQWGYRMQQTVDMDAFHVLHACRVSVIFFSAIFDMRKQAYICIYWIAATAVLEVSVVGEQCHVSTDPIHERSGKIFSHAAGGGSYNDNQDCKWRFVSLNKEWNALRIVLDPYDIRSTSTDECTEDVLVIQGRRFCGKVTRSTCTVLKKLATNETRCRPPLELRDPKCEIREIKSWPPRISFKTDEAGTAGGFSLAYSFHACAPETRSLVPVLSDSPRGVNGNDQVVSSRLEQTTASATTYDGSPSENGPDFTLLLIILLAVVVLSLLVALSIVLFRRRRRLLAKKTLDEASPPSAEPALVTSESVNDVVYDTIPDSAEIRVILESGQANTYGMVANVLYDKSQ